MKDHSPERPTMKSPIQRVSIDTSVLQDWDERVQYVSELAEIIGDSVRTARVGLGGTMTLVSSETGIPVNRVSSIEKGETIPTLHETRSLIGWLLKQATEVGTAQTFDDAAKDASPDY